MPQKLNLSTRLKKVAGFLPKGSNFADIGSDHAYLPCFVCMQDIAAKAIAGELNEGPFRSAAKTVQTYELSDRIDVRLGDGLEVIRDGEVEQIVIAGMGGALIQSILENGRDKLSQVKRIIAQPNVDAKNVRKWMMNHGYSIVAEEIIKENDHIYEIIVADKENGQVAKEKNRLSEQELLFGPCLLKDKSEVFVEKWQHEGKKLTKTIAQMKRANVVDDVKIRQFELQLSWIKEALEDG